MPVLCTCSQKTHFQPLHAKKAGSKVFPILLNSLLFSDFFEKKLASLKLAAAQRHSFSSSSQTRMDTTSSLQLGAAWAPQPGQWAGLVFLGCSCSNWERDKLKTLSENAVLVIRCFQLFQQTDRILLPLNKVRHLTGFLLNYFYSDRGRM